MDKAKQAFDKMHEHKMNCAQSVLTTFSEDYGLNKDNAVSIAQGFGGGMHIDSLCGAVTGAFMVLGLANPVSQENPRQNMDKTYALVAEFAKQFKARHGGLSCTELLGYNLSVPGEATKARATDVFITKCPVFVRDAVKIVEGLLKPV